MVFTDLEDALSFLDEFKKSGFPDTIAVHLQESATPEEQLAFEQLGAKVQFLSSWTSSFSTGDVEEKSGGSHDESR
jgi:hypothetical protein